MSGTSNLPQFQRFVWESLPIRKEAVGREAIDDVTILAVQMWPVEHLSQTELKTAEETVVLKAACQDIRRILAFVYGEDRFKGMWILGLHSMIPAVVEVVNGWWRTRKDNRAKLTMWRRKWVADE